MESKSRSLTVVEYDERGPFASQELFAHVAAAAAAAVVVGGVVVVEVAAVGESFATAAWLEDSSALWETSVGLQACSGFAAS